MTHERPCMCEPCTIEFILDEPPQNVYDFAVTRDGAIVVAYMDDTAHGAPTVEVISYCARTRSVTRMWRSYETGELAYEVFLQHADRP